MDQETVKQGRNSWQWAKHAWLYSDLLQALKQEPLTTLGNDIMNKMDVNFCIHSTLLWGWQRDRVKERAADQVRKNAYLPCFENVHIFFNSIIIVIVSFSYWRPYTINICWAPPSNVGGSTGSIGYPPL